MTSVTVVFVGTWITNPMTNLSVVGYKVDRPDDDSLNGSVRTYAGGRRRSITTPADTRQSTLTFKLVTASDLEVLRGWRGQMLLLRDFGGWRRWGTFFSFKAISMKGYPGLNTVTLTFEDLDYTEAV